MTALVPHGGHFVGIERVILVLRPTSRQVRLDGDAPGRLPGGDQSAAGYRNNSSVQSIAAWTRADAWGYAAPGWPEKAAELAFKDASANHRRNGVYGSMFFAAAIAAAFAVDDPVPPTSRQRRPNCDGG